MIKTARKLLIILIAALILATSTCSSKSDVILFEASPTATAVRNVLATRQTTFPRSIPPTATPIPSPIPTLANASTPTYPPPLPPTIEPTMTSTNGFCCLHLAAGPYAEAADTFPAGTEIIYAIWDYANLVPDDRIRRIWIRDDLIWLAREEKWDWEKYGAAGTVRDLSIFDFEGDGLQSGSYRLQLYLNDTLQEEAAFVILPP